MNTAPCRECPFRRASAPGYLGQASHDPHEFLGSHWYGFVPLPCHLRVNWEAPNAQEQVQGAQLCQGFLIMCKNACKLPLNSLVAEALSQVEPDRVNVFSHANEFCEHHA